MVVIPTFAAAEEDAPLVECAAVSVLKTDFSQRDTQLDVTQLYMV